VLVHLTLHKFLSLLNTCSKQVSIPDTNVAVELYLYDTAGQSVFNQSEADTAYFENVYFVMVHPSIQLVSFPLQQGRIVAVWFLSSTIMP